MNPSKFQAFLAEQKQQKQESEQVDWQATKQAWLNQANGFVESIKEFLAEFQSDINFEVERVSLTEEYLGSYQVPKLIVRLPKETIEFVPVGTLLIGAHGRYDMKGQAGTVKWVLVPETAEKPTISIRMADEPEPPKTKSNPTELAWKIATPPPHIRYIPFTQESLLEAIMEVSHG